jgi:hypothetical protein
MNFSERVSSYFLIFLWVIIMIFIKQVFFIFLFTFAASLFGTLLGQIQQVFATLNKKAKELEDYMEGYHSFFWDYKYILDFFSFENLKYISFLDGNRVTNYVKHRVQRWVQFQYSFDEAENRVLYCFPHYSH